MIYTARQIEQLHRANGHVTLPYDARLTPAARDWVRARRLGIEYTDGEARAQPPQAQAGAGRGAFLWWCDGPCGAAKAAILGQARQAHLISLEIGADPASTAAAVMHVAAEIKSQRVAGAIFAVDHGAVAMVMLNRCPSLRAVLGSCRESVDQAIRRVGANVLVLEHAHRTLVEMGNMIQRFTSTTARDLSHDVQRQLQELSTCG